MTLLRTIFPLVCAVCLVVGGAGAASAGEPAPGPGFSSRVVATGLANPWEITVGPDGFVWTTERTAGRVTRVDPRTGDRHTALTVPDVLATPGTQDGLLGMALHPGLLTGSRDRYVYLAYTYDADPDPATLRRLAKIVRYTVDRGRGTLGDPVNVITGLPASTDHNSGRLKVGPDRRLYYTIGDQGRNQFDYYCLPILAQRLPTAAEVRAGDWTAYQGKILRLGLDGSVPADNPVLRGVRSHVYSYGHRNAQGIAFAPDRRLYASEQGPMTDDEVNLVRAGGNYGWPRIAGFRDDRAYVYENWSASRDVPCPSLTYDPDNVPPSVPRHRETDFRARVVAPLRTFHTVGSDFNFRDPRCAENGWYFICWPTVAPSSLDVYGNRRGVPGWADSLLMPSLKDGTVYRMRIGTDGRHLGPPEALWRSVNRYRDTAVDATGTTVYVATDVAGLTRDLSGAPTAALRNPGAILAFHYSGQAG